MKRLTLLLLTSTLLHINTQAAHQAHKVLEKYNQLSEQTRGDIRCCAGCVTCCYIAPKTPHIICCVPLCLIGIFHTCDGLNQSMQPENKKRRDGAPKLQRMDAALGIKN